MWELVTWPGIKPRPPALWVWSLSHWTSREVPLEMFLFYFYFYFFFWVYFFFNLFITFILCLFIFFFLTCVPKHEPPSHLPPHNISLGPPHAPAPSKLHPTSDMDWRFNSYMTVYMLEGNDDPVCKTGKKTQMCITDFWTQRERERVGRFGRMGLLTCILSCKNWIASPCLT